MNALKIIRIVAIRDTRTYEEMGDRWVPIPGSGNEHECARCGRLHEVWAEVELEGGKNAIVGTGCADKADMAPELRAVARSGDRAAKRARALRAEIAALEPMVAKYREIAAWSERLPSPYIAETTDERGHLVLVVDTQEGHGEGHLFYSRQQVEASWERDRMMRQAREDAVRTWRQDAARRAGLPPHRAGHLDATREALAKLTRRHPEVAEVLQ